MRIQTTGVALVLSLLASTAFAQKPKGRFVKLFNGKNLDGFDTVPRTKGVYNNPENVFRVHDGMVHVSGTEYGYIITKQEYDNYHLRAEFKWGESTHEPRKDRARDSGILVHVIGEDKVWPTSIEYQIIEGRTGEMILVGNGSSWTRDGETKTRGETKTTRFARFGQGPWKDTVGFRSPENEAEKPHGEWNLLEVICEGKRVTFKANGKVVNQGERVRPSKGRILFQSEGAEASSATWNCAVPPKCESPWGEDSLIHESDMVPSLPIHSQVGAYGSHGPADLSPRVRGCRSFLISPAIRTTHAQRVAAVESEKGGL